MERLREKVQRLSAAKQRAEMLAINADIEQEEEDLELFGPGMAPPRVKTR